MQNSIRLYKLLNKDKNHFGFLYNSDGLNVDPIPFNPTGSCQAGGLYFLNEIQLINYAHYTTKSYWICRVKLPHDAQVYHEKGKSKADRLILYDCEEFDKENLQKYINFDDTQIVLGLVKENGLALRYVKEQTPEICLKAVKQNGFTLMYVKEQTPEICLAAVKQNGFTLRYVIEQTPEICLAAVKQNGLTLRYVIEQTPEICLAAVKQKKPCIGVCKNTRTK